MTLQTLSQGIVINESMWNKVLKSMLLDNKDSEILLFLCFFFKKTCCESNNYVTCAHYLLYYITMAKGLVKFFNDSKGFGFIVDEDTGNDIFVHVSGLVDEVKENDEVTFDVADGRKGLNAVDVKLV